jgi:hypothetical protein
MMLAGGKSGYGSYSRKYDRVENTPSLSHNVFEAKGKYNLITPSGTYDDHCRDIWNTKVRPEPV